MLLIWHPPPITHVCNSIFFPPAPTHPPVDQGDLRVELEQLGDERARQAAAGDDHALAAHAFAHADGASPERATRGGPCAATALPGAAEAGPLQDMQEAARLAAGDGKH